MMRMNVKNSLITIVEKKYNNTVYYIMDWKLFLEALYLWLLLH